MRVADAENRGGLVAFRQGLLGRRGRFPLFLFIITPPSPPPPPAKPSFLELKDCSTRARLHKRNYPPPAAYTSRQLYRGAAYTLTSKGREFAVRHMEQDANDHEYGRAVQVDIRLTLG